MDKVQSTAMEQSENGSLKWLESDKDAFLHLSYLPLQ